jgi:allophanate hydrolase
MTTRLIIETGGPGITVQDMGRPGFLAFGLSRGGAADRLALYEGAALLGQSPEHAVLEMAGMGGTFTATSDIRIALTGAPMRASIDGVNLVWNASHQLREGETLQVGAAALGVYGYLHIGGGIAAQSHLGAKSAHLAAGIGGPLTSGQALDIGPDNSGTTGLKLAADDRFRGGKLRLVQSLQTGFFAQEDLDRFQSTSFTRDTRGNRMGVRILPDGDGFFSQAGLNILSEVIVPGDVQITGDGTPFVLLCECQTTGGYPRIGSVLPSDMPKVAQARPGTSLQFEFVTLERAVAIERMESERRCALAGRALPLIRDPHDIADLLSYQLVGGVTAGDDL